MHVCAQRLALCNPRSLLLAARRRVSHADRAKAQAHRPARDAPVQALRHCCPPPSRSSPWESSWSRQVRMLAAQLR